MQASTHRFYAQARARLQTTFTAAANSRSLSSTTFANASSTRMGVTAVLYFLMRRPVTLLYYPTRRSVTLADAHGLAKRGDYLATLKRTQSELEIHSTRFFVTLSRAWRAASTSLRTCYAATT